MLTIRTATESDAAELLEIYRPHIEHSVVSFETTVPSVAEFGERIVEYASGWSWLLAEEDGRCAGYAYGSPHRTRAAYRWSVETSAYVHEAYRQRGLGKRLYAALFVELERKGFRNAYAGITMPNDASVALHRSVGFDDVGVFRNVGWKFGAWRDVAWMQRVISELPPD
jgi:phosphinothricin acetyltransferase